MKIFNHVIPQSKCSEKINTQAAVQDSK